MSKNKIQRGVIVGMFVLGAVASPLIASADFGSDQIASFLNVIKSLQAIVVSLENQITQLSLNFRNNSLALTLGSTQTGLYLQMEPSELSGTTNGSTVTPATGPTGTLSVKGTGSVNFTSAQTGNGAYFLQGWQQNTNYAFYKFIGSQIGNLFSPGAGEVTFYIKSLKSLAERQADDAASPGSYKFEYVFATYDSALKDFYGFYASESAGRISFNYRTGATANTTYYIPVGQEDAVYGKNVIAKIRIAWDGAQNELYVNDVLVKTANYTKDVTANFDATSQLFVGTASSYAGGYYTSRGTIIDEFKISPQVGGAVVPPVTPPASTTTPSTPAPTVTFTANSTSITSGQSTTLNWSSTNATTCNGTGFNANGSISGISTISPTANTTYLISCTGAGGSASGNVTVNVSSATPPQTVTPSVSGNGISLSNASGVAQTNYPMQIGRPFKQGDIQNFAQAVVDGVPILTQDDVKNRWPDGSIKEVILSFILPSLSASGSSNITFRNVSSQDGTNITSNTPLTQAQMLAAGYDFDAQIKLTSGSTVSASARAMLANGDYTYWTSGPIATMILLADDSVNRKYDIGFDSFKSVRPRFYATFWPVNNKVRIRFVGENSNTENMEDVTYSLALTLGNSSPQTVYTQAGINHFSGTRWTKEYWIGGAPENKININQNIGYLASTYLFPNYDPNIVFPSTKPATDYAAYIAKPTNIGDAGQWQKAMGTTGGRFDIGPITGWNAAWLFSGDWREKEIAFKQADLAGAWPLQVREGDPTKMIDKNQSVSGMGKTVVVYNRPTLWLFDTRDASVAADKVPINGIQMKTANGVWDGWFTDNAHVPDTAYPEYMLTGDYYYLEQTQLWAGAASLEVTPPGNGFYNRGPGAGIQNQVRGDAWALRNRVNAAIASPDGSAEKTVFSQMTDDALSLWEGQRNITGTSHQGNAMWNFGYNTSGSPTALAAGTGRWNTYGYPAMHFWELNTAPTFAVAPLNTDVKGATSNWMQNFLVIELGRTQEMGFDSQALLSWVGSNEISQLTDPSFNKWLIGEYHTPVAGADSKMYTTWAQVFSGFDVADQALTTWPGSAYPALGEGYAHIARGAIALAAGLPGGAQAWNTVMQMNAPYTAVVAADPRYAILPRGINSTPAPAPLPTASLSVTPSSISTGQSTTLSWNSTDATSCTGTGFNTAGARAGSITVSPTVTSTYSINCSNPTGSAIQTATLTVGAVVTPPPAPSTKFSLSDRVQATSNINVRGSANPTGTLLGTQTSGALGAVIAGPIANGGFNWWNINYDSGVDGWSAEDFLVKYTAPSLPPVDTVAPTVPSNLSATPASTTMVTLTWSPSTDATGVTGYKVFRNGTMIASPTITNYSFTGLSASTLYSFTVSAYDAAGNNSVQSSAVSTTTLALPVVSNPKPTVSLTPNPTSINLGAQSTLTWSSTNATSCTGTGFNTNSQTAGSMAVSPSLTSTYLITCTGSGGSANQSASVTVVIPQPTQPVSPVSSGGGGGGGSPAPTPTPSSSGGGGGSSSGGSGGVYIPPVVIPTPTTNNGNGNGNGNSGSSNGSPNAKFNRTLSVGATGNDVIELQQYLGVNPTGYFGELTKAAVARFQRQNGVNATGAGVGVVGPVTLGTLNTVFVGTPSGSGTSSSGSSNGTNTSSPGTAPSIPTSSPSSSSSFTITLSIGKDLADVKRLQQYLNAHGFVIATSGPGSSGNESTYFGAKTKAALIRFQEANRATILTPNGLISGTGVFGPSTRNLINQLMAQ